MDVSACVDESGWVNMVVVNVNEEQDFKVALMGIGEGKEVDVYTVTGANVKVVNVTGKEEEVGVKEGKWDGKGEFVFGKHSMTLLRWEGTK